MSPETTASQTPTASRTRRAVVPPANADINRARSFKPSAERMRAEVKLAVSEGRMSVDDVIKMAQQRGGKALYKLSLLDLLSEQVGPAAAGRTLSVLSARLGPGIDARDMTIAWLIDLRARARRYHTWESVLAARRPLESSFPYTRMVSAR